MTCPICDGGYELDKLTIQQISEEIVGHHKDLAKEIYKLLEYEASSECGICGCKYYAHTDTCERKAFK